MALLESLRAEQIVLLVIMITEHDDIDMAVQAMQKIFSRRVRQRSAKRLSSTLFFFVLFVFFVVSCSF